MQNIRRTSPIEHLQMMSQHSNSLATTTVAILVQAAHQNGRCFHSKRIHANALYPMYMYFFFWNIQKNVLRQDQFNFLFHGLILSKYESVGRQKKNESH